MKSYVVVKFVSKSLIGLSVLLMILSLGIFAYDYNKASADDPGATVTVSGYQSEVDYSPGTIQDIPLGTISSSASGLHHISIFVSKANYTFSPPNTEAGKNQICTAADERKDIYLMGQITCPATGDCTDSTKKWTTSTTTTAGRHQIFAVAMNRDTSSSGCTAAAISGWSSPTTQINLIAPIPAGSNSDKIHLEGFSVNGSTITEFNKLKKGEKVTFHARVDSFPADVTDPINHVSLLISKPADTNTPEYSSGVGRKTLCTEATNRGDCMHLCPISLYKACDATTGICEPFEWTPTNTGQHRLMVMAMTSPDGTVCQPAGVAGYNGSQVVRVLNEDGSDPDAGDGGDDTDHPTTEAVSIDDPFAGNIDSTKKLITKVYNLLLMLIGAFSVIAIIIGGIQFITSSGNPNSADKAKKTITYAILGILITTCALVIEQSMVSIINNISQGRP